MRALLLLLGAALVALPVPAFSATRTYALIVGNNASPPEDDTLAPLRYADDDAVRYYGLLAPRADEVHLLTVADAETQKRHVDVGAIARAPSREALRAAVEDLRARIEADRANGDDAILYFAFSGHGSNDVHGEPYLALLGESLTQRALFTEVIDRLPAARVHLIVDACNAGAVVGVRGPFDNELESPSVPVSSVEARAVLEQTSLAAYPHVGAIVATSAGQESHEWSRIQSGVFTHELVSGALGPADINGDHRIEYSEIQAFIAAANRAVADPRAKPMVRAIPPAVDRRAALVDWTGEGVRRLEGRAGRWGRFYIELDNGLRYLDAHVQPGAPLSIVLPAGAIAYLRTAEREAVIDGRGERIAVEELSFRPTTIAARGSLDDALRRALFAEPYTSAYYRGFVDSRDIVGVPTDVRVDLASDDDGLTGTQALGLTVGGVGLAAVATAVVTAAISLEARSDFEATNIQSEAVRLASKEKTYRTLAIVLGAAGIAATGAGITLYITGARGPEAGVAGRF